MSKQVTMHARHAFAVALAAAAFPALLAGCAGGSTTTASLPQSLSGAPLTHRDRHSTLLLSLGNHRQRASAPVRSWLKRVPRQAPLLYISDPYLNAVNIYDQNESGQTPIGQIGGFDEPQSLWVTVTQKLWVANTNAMNLQEYDRGSVVPIRTVSDPNGFPAGVCGNNNKKLVYAVDIVSPSDGNGQTIDVYNKSATTPSQVLTDPNAENLYECAVDAQGNLFVTLSNLYGYGEVDEFAKGSTTPVPLITNLIYPIGITIDQYGALAVDDALASYPSEESVIYLYDPPYTSGPAYSFSTNGVIVQTALDHTRTHLWGADSLNVVGQEWSYPHGLPEDQTSSQNLTYPDGIAVSPAAKP